MSAPTINNVRLEVLILDHLRKHGSISGMEAQGMFRCRSLTRRITTLRRQGVAIRAEWKNDTTGQRYTRYFLEPVSVAA